MAVPPQTQEQGQDEYHPHVPAKRPLAPDARGCPEETDPSRGPARSTY
jgi:hypothetical protein